MNNRLFLQLILIISLPLNVLAANQYHCNGKIQYRPCHGSSAAKVSKGSATKALAAAQQNALKASFKYQKQMKEPSGAVYADIISAKYSKYPKRKGYGQWRGVVKGNGDIHLQLKISQ